MQTDKSQTTQKKQIGEGKKALMRNESKCKITA